MFQKATLAAVCVLCALAAAGQTTTIAGGNWNDASIWSAGVPAAGTTTTVTYPVLLTGDLSISGSYTFSNNVTDVTGGSNYSLTLTGTLDVTAGTTVFEGNGNINNGSTLYVRNGATLILGNTSVGNNVTLLVEAGGTLIINGSLTNSNNSGTFTIGGIVYVNGNFNNGGTADLTGTGDIITTNALNNTGSSTTFGSGSDCSTGPCSGRNLCSFSNTIASNQTLCSGSTPAALSGNAVTSPTYLWESSTTSSSTGFSTAAGTSNGQNYTPGALTQTMWYRRKVTASGCTGTSVPVQVTVVSTAGGWKGTTNNWNTASNWCNNAVPTSTTDVTISTGVPNQPQVTAASSCRNLVINAGASVTLNASNTLDIYGNFTNNGTFTTNSSTVTLRGTSQTVSGNSITFNNLVINNSATSVSSYLTVQSTLTMTAGTINLAGYTFTLGANGGTIGTLSYTAGWMYNGTFQRWVSTSVMPDGDVRGLFPMGTSTDKRRMYVSFPTTAPNPAGTISVRHMGATTTSTVSVTDGASTIARRQDSYWNITSGNSLAGGTYNLRAGGTGFGTVGNLANLRLMRASDVTGTNGGTVAGSTVTDFLVIRTGISLTNLASNFYVGSVDAIVTPLPVKLVTFTAVGQPEGIQLDWVTASEDDLEGFQIERASEDLVFEPIAKADSKGGTKLKATYRYVDENPLGGRNYYRLKSIDIDGTFEYSDLVYADWHRLETNLYPNPVTNKKVTLEMRDNVELPVVIKLVNSLGCEIFYQQVDTQKKVLELPDSLMPGVYYLKVVGHGANETLRLIVQ